jgi:Protein of unknown function (DUF2815)
MAERLEFFTPVVGRFVRGDITEKRTKDNDGRDILPEKQQYQFGIAFEKAAIWPMLTEQWYPWIASQVARDQNAMQRLQGWFSTLDGYSMKVSDGDKPNQKGQFNEHTKGCFVINLSSNFIPKCVGPDAAYTEIDAVAIKRGYYVQLAGNITPNGEAGDRTGIYINPSVVRLIAEGDEIKGGGVDAATAFGGTAAPMALPPGARALGSASGGAAAFGGAPGLPPAGVPAPVGMAPVGLPGLPGVGAAPSTASPINPHTGILTGPPGMPPR